MILEEKTNGSEMPFTQREAYKLLAIAIRSSNEKNNGLFGGAWLITFHGYNATTPHNADRITLENIETEESSTVSIEECIDFLSMVA